MHPQALALRAGVQALGLSLDDRRIDQLLAYLDLLAKWNKVYNLTAVRDPEQMLAQHLLDSLAVIAPLRSHAGGRPLRLLSADWRIDYEYDSDDAQALPARLFAQRADGAELRLRIDEWSERPAVLPDAHP